jgi:hypothetical protein
LGCAPVTTCYAYLMGWSGSSSRSLAECGYDLRGFGAQGQDNDAEKKKSADIAYLSVCVCVRVCVSFFLVYSS